MIFQAEKVVKYVNGKSKQFECWDAVHQIYDFLDQFYVFGKFWLFLLICSFNYKKSIWLREQSDKKKRNTFSSRTPRPRIREQFCELLIFSSFYIQLMLVLCSDLSIIVQLLYINFSFILRMKSIILIAITLDSS